VTKRGQTDEQERGGGRAAPSATIRARPSKILIHPHAHAGGLTPERIRQIAETFRTIPRYTATARSTAWRGKSPDSGGPSKEAVMLVAAVDLPLDGVTELELKPRRRHQGRRRRGRPARCRERLLGRNRHEERGVVKPTV
jgi:hypothetical protein